MNLLNNIFSIGKGVIIKQFSNIFNLLGYIKQYGIYIIGAIGGILLFFFMKSNHGKAAVQTENYKEVKQETKEAIKEIKELTKQSDILENNIKQNDIETTKKTEEVQTIINTTVQNIEENKQVIDNPQISKSEKIKNTKNRIEDVLNKLKQGN